MKILSCGAGMQSTALCLMACEKALLGYDKYPLVPIYDAVIFCDLGKEPPWVYSQVAFMQNACKEAGINFVVLDTHLYQDIINNFGIRRVVAIPWWTIGEDGKPGKLQRKCTIDYKIDKIQKYVKWNLLGYKKYQRIKEEDKGAHEMHIGFSVEETQRIFDSKHPLFVNRFPLADMGLERANNYAYCRDVWGLVTKASACNFCPFHRNYFFQHLKENYEEEYEELVEFDNLLEREQPNSPIRSQIFISRSRKRICDLTCEECQDGEFFDYKGEDIWNGF